MTTKKTILIILLSVLTFQFLHSSNKWELVYSDDDHPAGIKRTEITDISIGGDGKAYASIVYFFEDDWDKRLCRVISSADGMEWKTEFEFDESEMNYISCVAVGQDGSVYLGMEENYIRYSRDWGETWSETFLGEGTVKLSDIVMLGGKRGISQGYHAYTEDGWETFTDLFYAFPVKDSASYFFPMLGWLANDSLYFMIGGNTYTKKIEMSMINLTTMTREFVAYPPENVILSSGFNNGNSTHTLAFPGWSYKKSGGSANDYILISRDNGKSWDIKLDLYAYSNGDSIREIANREAPFALDGIVFNNPNQAIAYGTPVKVLYSYDGGDTWIYEPLYPKRFSTKHVVFLKDRPIMSTIEGEIMLMTEDNFAPKPEDIYDISGRVMFGDEPVQVYPVVLDSRVCMTDSSGYYRFTKVSPGQHRLRVINKHYDGDQYPEWYQKPYKFEPYFLDVEVDRDTIINFTAKPNIEVRSPGILGCASFNKGDVYPGGLSAAWNDVNYATGYEVWFLRYEDNHVLEKVRTDSARVTIEGYPIGRYRFVVRSIFPDTSGQGGETLSLFSEPCSAGIYHPIPEVSEGFCDVPILDYGDTLQWETPFGMEEDLLEYELEVFSDSALKNPQARYTLVFDNRMPLGEEMNLVPDAPYWWRLRSKNYGEEETRESLWSLWTEPCSFTTVPWLGVGGVEEGEIAPFRLHVMDERIQVYSQEDIFSLQLSDLSGRVVAKSSSELIEIQKLPPGPYFLLINGETMQKILLTNEPP